MYEQYFGLHKRAFDLNQDPGHFLPMASHREALANIEYAIETKLGITLLIGDAGTGKTTVLRRALENDARKGNDRTLLYVANPALTRAEFFECLADRFDLGEDAGSSKTRFLRHLERHLREQSAVGRSFVLVIDEAQSVPDDLLEEIRLLRNIATQGEELLPLILSGQPELAVRLTRPDLRQFKQRIALRCVLGPLSVHETANYIAGRIRLVGGNAATMFSREAVVAIHEYSAGIPRTISAICENALLTAFATGRRRVGVDIVAEVSRDLDYSRWNQQTGTAERADAMPRQALRPVSAIR